MICPYPVRCAGIMLIQVLFAEDNMDVNCDYPHFGNQDSDIFLGGKSRFSHGIKNGARMRGKC